MENGAWVPNGSSARCRVGHEGWNICCCSFTEVKGRTRKKRHSKRQPQQRQFSVPRRTDPATQQEQLDSLEPSSHHHQGESNRLVRAPERKDAFRMDEEVRTSRSLCCST